MTAGGPRNRYVDPASREMAEDLARRSGLSLNEWVSRLMADGPEDATSQDYFNQRASQPNYYEAPREPPRYETVAHPGDEATRVTSAIERLSERIASAENRQAMAIAGIERSVREVIARIDGGEREQMEIAARFDEAERAQQQLSARFDDAERERQQIAAHFEGVAQEARDESSRLSERMRRIEEEAAGPRSREALRALEGALGKVASHVYEADKRARDGLGELRGRVERLNAAEQATVGAIHDLRTACSALDQRLNIAERGAEESLERAAQNLSARVESARDDLAAQLAAAAESRFERMEQVLARMGEHVREAEQRQTGALERMGREVLDVAQTLHRRVQGVEHGSLQAAEQVRAEVSRITGAVEDRLARADSIQAQALEKLGGEIARITERLADRIANAERRSAQAIDDVGEQVARITERVTQRQERSVTELADRIRQSEERTARLLEEARQKIDERLSETQRRIVETPRLSAATADEDDALFGDAPFPGFEIAPAERPRNEERPEPFESTAPRLQPSRFDDTDFEAAAHFDAPVPPPAPSVPAAHAEEFDDVELEPNVGFDVDDELIGPAQTPGPQAPPLAEPLQDVAEPALQAAAPAPAAADAPPGALTTREVIERARAAARAASERDAPRPRQSQASASTPPPPRAGADDTIVQSITFGRSRRRSGGVSGAVMVASILAAIGLSASGYVFLQMQPSGGKTPKRVADQLNIASDKDQPGGNSPLAAVALSPQPANLADLTAQYTAAVTRISADPKSGLADIRKLADGGYAPAQFYLAELYQNGKAGLHRDPAQARVWLQHAAEGGDRTAMHNLALDLHEGVGGPKDAAAAAEWFRRAAELGLLDSQFNLAAIYERGDGVSQNLAEAYKWYLIAGRAGDAESRAGALRVRAGLSADERAMAERAAADFQPAAANPSTTPPGGSTTTAAAAPSPDLVTAQHALNQLGYYQGPTDGAASPALHLALAAYQRDQNLPVTGDPDQTTLGKLQPYVR